MRAVLRLMRRDKKYIILKACMYVHNTDFVFAVFDWSVRLLWWRYIITTHITRNPIFAYREREKQYTTFRKIILQSISSFFAFSLSLPPLCLVVKKEEMDWRIIFLNFVWHSQHFIYIAYNDDDNHRNNEGPYEGIARVEPTPVKTSREVTFSFLRYHCSQCTKDAHACRVPLLSI